MALSALQASQLSTLLAGHAKAFTANNPGQNEFADYLLRSGQSATMGLLAEEEQKKAKKKQKGLLGGKIGSTLGTAAGIALAPVTGGASLAAAGALGGGLGGLAGQYIAGGSPSATSFALDAAQGGMTGYDYGKAGELASSVETSGVTPDIPASPTIAQKIGDGIQKGLPNANVISNTLTPKIGGAPMTSRVNYEYPTSPIFANPGLAGVPQAAQRVRPSFGNRFMGALGHTLSPQQPRPQSKFLRKLSDDIELYE